MLFRPARPRFSAFQPRNGAPGVFLFLNPATKALLLLRCGARSRDPLPCTPPWTASTQQPAGAAAELTPDPRPRASREPRAGAGAGPVRKELTGGAHPGEGGRGVRIESTRVGPTLPTEPTTPASTTWTRDRQAGQPGSAHEFFFPFLFFSSARAASWPAGWLVGPGGGGRTRCGLVAGAGARQEEAGAWARAVPLLLPPF